MPGHFDGTGPTCNIHTTRKGTCAQGPCDYRENCSELAHAPWNAHHILCVASVNAYPELSAYNSYVPKIDDTYKATTWCINQSANMIGLPLKSTHVKYPSIRALGLPAHDVDHNCTAGYTEEVRDAIDNLIWDKVKKAVDTATKNKTHFTPEDVAKKFTTLITKYKGELHKRGGKRSGGTAVAWTKRGSTTNGWWMAFSMAKTSVAMARPLATL